MTDGATTAPESPTPAISPSPPAPRRAMYWAVRRELWENRSIYAAPLAAALVFLFGFSLSTLVLPRRVRGASFDPATLKHILVTPFSVAPAVIIMTAYIVGAFYCIDTLFGERRDRSILFWKSLPVSDLTTVLSKASIPFVILPLIAMTTSLVTQLIMVFLSTFSLVLSGVGAAALSTRLPLLQMTIVMLYGVTVHALWHAPLYAWLLLVSSWARRMPLLWVVLPPLGIAVFEAIVFHSSHFASLLRYRLVGAMAVAFAAEGENDVLRVAQLDPARFLASPGLWLGLVFAAAFLAAAARQRRDRDPV